MSKFKIGDLVEFIEYENGVKWESLYGLDIGDVVMVTFSEGENLWVLSNTGKQVSVCPSRVLNCTGGKGRENLNEEGVKYDSDKLEYSLIPKGVLNKVISVLGFGSKKYAKDNWMKVDNPKERYYNAAQRHINQWWEGEKYDSETGENHLAHAICCLMFMLWFDNQEDEEVNK